MSNLLAQDGRVQRLVLVLSGAFVVVALVTVGVTGLLINIFEHRQEARAPFVRLSEVDELTTDPVPWGNNWPYQFDTYRRTVDVTKTRYGGSSAMPESKLEADPWLRRLYAGYAFSIDYRERRGHAYMLYDQEVTERVTKRPQSGACLHCHASVTPTYRRLGLEAMGKSADIAALRGGFDWEAVMKGFEVAGKLDYAAAHAALLSTPDGTPDVRNALFPGGVAKDDISESGAEPAGQAASTSPDPHMGEGHPVSCVDCHDPASMQIRVTRPGFMNGIAAFAASEAPAPHLPSIERWRDGDRKQPFDPNRDASRRELRTFVCAQCHVEYYCASKETLFYPWSRGLKVEEIEAHYEAHTFPDGAAFFDYKHGETGAPAYKAQHPEFELWSQGVHARSGVSCVDCHMPYERQGAMKVSNHWVRSPLLNISASCQTCHHVPEAELLDKVTTIQDRTRNLIEVAAVAMTDMLDAIRAAQASGVGEEVLAPILVLQRKAMFRLDYVSSENSMGFHADQESARILAESIDYSRRAQALALMARAPMPAVAPDAGEPVLGVSLTVAPAEHGSK